MSDGLFVFELLTPGSYKVRFDYGGPAPVDRLVTVTAGVATYVEADGC